VADIARVAGFLEGNSLTTVGLHECLENFLIAFDGVDSWIGVAGYELYGASALLRSVAVDKGSRRKGVGRTLVEESLSNASKRGARTIYLLTDTAEAYFVKLGFKRIDRNQVDEAVRASPEFGECCKSAQMMRKSL
jgi:amino-acid N-acetyltransferase